MPNEGIDPQQETSFRRCPCSNPSDGSGDAQGPHQHEEPTGANAAGDESRGVRSCKPSSEFPRFEAANPPIWLPVLSTTNRLSLQRAPIARKTVARRAGIWQIPRKPLVIRIIVRYRTILVPSPETRHQLRARCSRLKAYERSASMALSPFIVHVPKKRGFSFGELMRDARCWLDRHEIESMSFKPVTSAATGVGFDIGFNIEDNARLFKQAFS